MSSFIHLNNHSDFSLLESSQSIKSIVDRANDLSMHSVAITEKGNLFSMVSFYKYAKQKKIKPIIGCEMNVIDNLNSIKSSPNKINPYSLVLLAKNNMGYLNLMKLVSLSYVQHTYHIPLIDKNLLQEFSKGLIAMSSGLNGEIMQHLLTANNDKVKEIICEYKAIFKDNFYLEIQNHNIK